MYFNTTVRLISLFSSLFLSFQVSMMNSTPVESDEMAAMPLIKKEETENKPCFQPCSPSSVATTTLYSPTTTVLHSDVIFFLYIDILFAFIENL